MVLLLHLGVSAPSQQSGFVSPHSQGKDGTGTCDRCFAQFRNLNLMDLPTRTRGRDAWKVVAKVKAGHFINSCRLHRFCSCAFPPAASASSTDSDS